MRPSLALVAFTFGPWRPMNILDPKFRYVDSYSTDLRKTFARVRREARERAAADEAERQAKVRAIAPVKARKAAS